MLLMLVDHVREFFYLHAQVRDPMDLAATPPDLFLTRAASHLCAPVFVLLTGLSACLYGQKHGRRSTAAFLLKRGLLLILLEVTLVSFAWAGSVRPSILYLQVIWVIGLCMVALAGLLWLPRLALVAGALALMLGHNLLDGIAIRADEPGYVLWSILHQRGMIALPWGGLARTSYPLLPWIGVIAAGYALGPLFAGGVDPARRRARLLGLGAAALVGFLALRVLNGYGEPVPWQPGATPLATALSFVNLTKYPPSADFLLLTLGLGLGLLALFETLPQRLLGGLRVFGGAPLFFYLLHLALLRFLYDGAAALGLAGASGRVEAGSPLALWLIAAAVSVPLWLACRAMVRLKRASTWPALSYL
ncbi:heparan-alpha-glucosaminide N-acetyltransferase domain-containing protein [Methylobacterium organophilum]|nr:heparan-alpha-glucosaminide N-acetyltransferase domain-containing protein [Methylobacterium organophilum]